MNFLIPIYQLSTHNRPKLLLIIYNRLHLELNQFKPPICRHLLSFPPHPTPPHIPLTFNVRQSESRRLSMGFLLPLTFTQGELNWILNICTSIISQAASFLFLGRGKKTRSAAGKNENKSKRGKNQSGWNCIAPADPLLPSPAAILFFLATRIVDSMSKIWQTQQEAKRKTKNGTKTQQLREFSQGFSLTNLWQVHKSKQATTN